MAVSVILDGLVVMRGHWVELEGAELRVQRPFGRAIGVENGVPYAGERTLCPGQVPV